MRVVSLRRWLVSTLSILALFQVNNVSALGLIEAYDAALMNDSAHRAAIHENEAGQQFKAVGRASLLPVLSGAYTTSENMGDVTRDTITQHLTYRSENANIQLRQPVVNLEAFAKYKQGVAQTSLSDSKFITNNQDLIVRLVSAYAEARYAEDQLALTVSQLSALADQRLANDRMFEKGEGTRTEILETQTKFDLAEAQVLEARDSLTNARNVLAAIVGDEITALDPLLDDFRVKPMQPGSFDEWKIIALENNPEITTQRHAVEIARQEINKQRAGHAPRLDVIASVTKTKSDNIIFFGLDTFTRSIGVQVNMPLYAGGSVNALTSQAVSNHEKAKADLETKINQVLIELRKQFNLTLTSVRRIEALEKSVNSGTFLLDATQKSVKGGTRTNIDILNAQQQLFKAKLELTQARYSYLLGYLRLRRAAGTIDLSDLQDVAKYFIARQ
ncbi:TolC family outer membrane protein [Nitrosospira sp. Nsp13]|jgi:protease secretion system outer membrane protein|uniref:TolC family outer membrane protein n=1 Tax=Nitrosospira sp. Nsp13 TaxID=1855332 RepID=UPI00088BB6DC|nr:TolC family outer membrane protein [Nitrosospira sp. Nsp13]SCY49256.1 outer membrane protein, protease secretion system [Nitrosospira sp. Nsp13]